MEAKEIAAIVDSMYEDELDVLSQLLALSEPERPDAMILRENGLPFCPVCGCVLSKNGTDGKGHQKWICGGCGKTVSSSTPRPTARTRLSARKWLSFVKCELAGVPLRLSSAYCRVSLKTAFMLRHKLQCAISSVVSAISLAGRVCTSQEKVDTSGTPFSHTPYLFCTMAGSLGLQYLSLYWTGVR